MVWDLEVACFLGPHPQIKQGQVRPGVMWRLQNAICGSRGPLETQEPTKVVWVSAFVLIKVRSILVKRKIMALGQSSPQHLIRSAGGYKLSRALACLRRDPVLTVVDVICTGRLPAFRGDSDLSSNGRIMAPQPPA